MPYAHELPPLWQTAAPQQPNFGQQLSGAMQNAWEVYGGMNPVAGQAIEFQNRQQAARQQQQMQQMQLQEKIQEAQRQQRLRDLVSALPTDLSVEEKLERVGGIVDDLPTMLEIADLQEKYASKAVERQAREAETARKLADDAAGMAAEVVDQPSADSLFAWAEENDVRLPGYLPRFYTEETRPAFERFARSTLSAKERLDIRKSEIQEAKNETEARRKEIEEKRRQQETDRRERELQETVRHHMTTEQLASERAAGPSRLEKSEAIKNLSVYQGVVGMKRQLEKVKAAHERAKVGYMPATGVLGGMAEGIEAGLNVANLSGDTTVSDFRREMQMLQSLYETTIARSGRRLAADPALMQDFGRSLGFFGSEEKAGKALESIEQRLDAMLDDFRPDEEALSEDNLRKLRDWDRELSEPAAEVTKGPKRIKTDAEYDALPKDAEFIGPDGKRRRKP